jgi:hypothetical protein
VRARSPHPTPVCPAAPAGGEGGTRGWRPSPGAAGRGAPGHGGLPDAWEDDLAHEISAALAVSLRTADQLVGLAWQMRARLPGIGALLAGGTIDLLKARIISDKLSVLDDEQAAQAEKLVLDELAGKTPGQVREAGRPGSMHGGPGRGPQAAGARGAG